MMVHVCYKAFYKTQQALEHGSSILLSTHAMNITATAARISLSHSSCDY